MALSEDDRRDVAEVVRNTLQQVFDEQGMNVSDHAEHHSFICSLRKAIKTGRTAMIWGLIGGFLTGVGWMIRQAAGL